MWAFSAFSVRFGQDYNAATLSFLPNFLAKTMDPSRPETDYAPVTIPALGPSMGEDLPDRFLCPVKALRYYLKLKHRGLDPNNRFHRLLCAFKLGHTGDISKQTVSGWIRQLIKQAYSAVQDEDIPHLTYTNFQARELRAFASSLAFHQNYSLKQVMEVASWRNNNTFRGWSESHILLIRYGIERPDRCWLLSHCFHRPEPGDTVSNGTLSHQAGLWQIRDRRLHSTFRVSSLQNVY